MGCLIFVDYFKWQPFISKFIFNLFSMNLLYWSFKTSSKFRKILNFGGEVDTCEMYFNLTSFPL